MHSRGTIITRLDIEPEIDPGDRSEGSAEAGLQITSETAPSADCCGPKSTGLARTAAAARIYADALQLVDVMPRALRGQSEASPVPFGRDARVTKVVPRIMVTAATHPVAFALATGASIGKSNRTRSTNHRPALLDRTGNCQLMMPQRPSSSLPPYHYGLLAFLRRPPTGFPHTRPAATILTFATLCRRRIRIVVRSARFRPHCPGGLRHAPSESVSAPGLHRFASRRAALPDYAGAAPADRLRGVPAADGSGGPALDSAGVAAVYLAHGTFVGPDALGVLAGLARVFPKAGTAVRRVIKRIVDKITGEVGNYTGQFAQCFESAINRPDRPHIPVRRFALVEREPSSRPRRRRRPPDRRTGRPTAPARQATAALGPQPRRQRLRA